MKHCWGEALFGRVGGTLITINETIV